MELDHQGHRKRLRQRFQQAGLDAFAPHEVLEMLLTFAIPRRDTKPIAYALINRFGSLHMVLQATTEELMQVEGVGEQAATLLAMMVPLFRAYRRSIEEETAVLTNQAQAARYCESLFEGRRYECFYIVCLDARMRVLKAEQIAMGDVTEVHVYARHVVNALMQCSAVGALIAHNHPSGSAAPSQEDIRLTNAIARLLEGVGIRLYDHMIVSPLETFSFRQGCLLASEDGSVTEAAQQFERVLPAVRHEIYRAGIVKRRTSDEN